MHRSDLLRQTIECMPAFIRNMPLLELSRVGSLTNSEDFRTGRTLFSKAALMAKEYDLPKDSREEATARFVSRDEELGREVGTRVSSR